MKSPRLSHMYFEPIETPLHVLLVARGEAQSYRVTNEHGFTLEFTVRHDEDTITITSDIEYLSDFVMNMEGGEFELCGGRDLYHICYDHGYDEVRERLSEYFKSVVV